MKSLSELAIRKIALLDKVEQQRTVLAQSMAMMRQPLGWADQGLRVTNYLRHQPVLLTSAAVGVAVAILPRGMKGWVKRGLLIWKTAGAVKRSLAP